MFQCWQGTKLEEHLAHAICMQNSGFCLVQTSRRGNDGTLYSLAAQEPLRMHTASVALEPDVARIEIGAKTLNIWNAVVK